jgi:glyoxalase family protein
MVEMHIPGIHHVTAIAGDPQRNVDFYCGVLGLRLVKQTVNFDDPATYHLYYGDSIGTPGSILTFFPWRDMPQGRRGTGETVAIAFRVGPDALLHWQGKLKASGVEIEGPFERFADKAIAFSDTDGMRLEIVGSGEGDEKISGFHGVTLSEAGYEATANLLTKQFGYRLIRSEGNRFRYEAVGDALGRVVDLLCQPDGRRGIMGSGIVHHVAFRAESDEAQLAWRTQLTAAGQNVTPVLDRQYFHSIYFREPGGVLFEIATDPPGFAIDETPETLGHALKLPPWLESERREIEAILPKLSVPEYSRGN